MMHSRKSSPIVQRDGYRLVKVNDYGGCYILKERIPLLHIQLYHGERILYQTFGQDTSCGGGWRGNLTDSWPCHDFHYDLKSALEWMHNSEDSLEDTLYLWTTLEKEDDYE